MARITVAADSLREGTFPPVCAKTGVHTDSYVTWTFSQTPGWTWLLLPFGILPCVIARLLTTTTFRGVLPVAPTVVTRTRRLGRLAALLAIAGVVTGAAGMASDASLAAGAVLLAAALAAYVTGIITAPDARRNASGVAVELRRVHPTFVQTIEAAWAQRESTT